jgi:hypothetical protein
MKQTSHMLAETLGWDIADLRECRYQRYTLPKVYSIGDRYFAVHTSKPKHDDVGGYWELHTDQFGVRGTDYKIWVSQATKHSLNIDETAQNVSEQ